MKKKLARAISLILCMVLMLGMLTGMAVPADAAEEGPADGLIDGRAREASYPSMYIRVWDIPPENRTVDTTILLPYSHFAVYNHEILHDRIYGPDGSEISYFDEQVHNSSLLNEGYIRWDTTGYEPGIYTIVTWVDFYSYLEWHTSPEVKTIEIELTRPYPAGWNQVDGHRVYMVPGVGFVRDEWYEIDGELYFFDENGYMVTNKWIAGEYFVDANGRYVPEAKPVTALSSNESVLYVTVGENTTFKPVFTPKDAYDQRLKFSTGNTQIATVDRQGCVTGVSAGNTWLYATAHNGIQTKILVTVKNAVSGVVIPSEQKVEVGSEVHVEAGIYPSDAYPDYLRYRIGNTNIASVDANGNVTGVSVGNTWLYATAENGVQGRCLIKVLPVAVTSLTNSYSEKTMGIGDRFTFAPTVHPYNATYRSLKFRTGNSKIATVDNHGNVTGVSAGNTWLYATAHNGKQLKVLVKVLPNATGVDVPNEQRVNVGATVKVPVKLTPSNANPEKITYTIGNSKVAMVDANGNVRGVGVGNTWLTVRTASGKTDKCLIRVQSVSVTAVTYPLTEKRMPVGGSFRFTPTVAPANATNKTLKFRTGNTSIATVDAQGNVKAVGVGNTWLYATSGNGKQVKVLLRIQPAVQSVTAPSEQCVTAGSTVKVTAKLNPSNAYQEKISFRTGNAAIATVDANGNVRGVGIGNTWLHITSESGKTAKCLIRVTR